MVFDYGKQVYTTVVLLLLCCRRALLLLSAPFILIVHMTSSRVRLGQSFKTVGYGCASCWADVGGGNVEADVFYIPFIVSVQYIGY